MPKVIDAFMFCNELELLDIRLNHLYDYVYKFILVEAAFDHHGRPKELTYDINKDRYAKYWDKIIHVMVPGPKVVVPEDCDYEVWDNENYQRQCIIVGLNSLNLSVNDIIMVSDMDEIPNAEVVKALPQINFNEVMDLEKNKNNLPLLSLSMIHYDYFPDLKHGPLWPGTVIGTYKSICEVGPQHFRNRRYFPSAFVSNGGWHFSHMGGPEKLILKSKRTPHTTAAVVKEGRYSEESIKKAYKEKWLLWRKNEKMVDDIPKSHPFDFSIYKGFNRQEYEKWITE